MPDPVPPERAPSEQLDAEPASQSGSQSGDVGVSGPSRPPARQWPREQTAPQDGYDFTDRVLQRATDSLQSAGLHLLVFLGAALAFGLLVAIPIGIAMLAHSILGLPPWLMAAALLSSTGVIGTVGYRRFRSKSSGTTSGESGNDQSTRVQSATEDGPQV